MRLQQLCQALVIALLAARQAVSAEPRAAEPAPYAPGTAGIRFQDPPVNETVPAALYLTLAQQTEKGKDVKTAPQPDPFAAAPPAEPEVSVGFNPNMIGDLWGGGYSLRTISLPATQTVFIPARIILDPMTESSIELPASTITTQTNVPVTVRVPITGLGAFKVGENASPIPQDRVFGIYRYFDGLQGPPRGTNTNQTLVQTVPVDGMPTSAVPGPQRGPLVQAALGDTVLATITTVLAGAPVTNLHQQVIGFEKTFLNGSASIETRLPIFEESAGGGEFHAAGIGDLTIIGKYAPLLDRTTGNVFSLGLALTVPTGPSIATDAGTIRPFLFQPFVGGRYNIGPYYLQGFSSVVMPTQGEFPTLLFNDLSLGYWLYQAGPDRFIRAVVPTIEAHVATPLNHRNAADAIVFPDEVDITFGTQFWLGARTNFTIGVITPVTGPRPYNIEVVTYANFRF